MQTEDEAKTVGCLIQGAVSESFHGTPTFSRLAQYLNPFQCNPGEI